MPALQYLLANTLRPLRAQNAYKEAMLIHDWETIVGSELARGFAPLEIRKTSSHRTLLLQTTSSGMATATYVEPMLLERVNRFFGEPYISNIKTSHGKIPKSVKVNKKTVSLVDPQTIHEALEAIGKHCGAND